MAAHGTDERKLATVLFADLVGSTALAGSEDPERVRVLLDRFYDAMAAEVETAGGTLEKFAGDAVMAAFGAPAALEDHAERALHAALSMQRRLHELFEGALQLRIGVNTGEVVVGQARAGSSFVTGDAVNVAARLEQAAAPGEILVGERAVAAVRGAFELGDRRVVEAKGKPGGVECRRLVRALSLMRPRGVSGLAAAFVGRDSELALLQATYRRVAERREPHLVTIMGDAGVGKTRLVRELWAWLAGESPQPLQRTGRCLAYGKATYWALGEVLKEHLGLLESDSPEAARNGLGDRQLLGLALGLDVAGDLHPLAARERMYEAWVDFLGELAEERPAVVLVEDLHWAEEPLLELLERTVRDVRGPVLLVGTARPELLDRRPAWGGGRRNASLLGLEPLTEAEAGAMLETLLAAALTPELRDVVVARAEGNPFFVEELLAALIDRGILERQDGGWRAHEPPPDFSVPDSVQAILAARLDLLAPAEKAGLQAASVIGRVFWGGPVSVLAEQAEPDWRVLEDRDFVRRRSGSSMAGEQEYAFKHALTREVAYASLPKARRGRLHARFADWLEAFGGRRDELAPLLAHHYAEAVRPEDADLVWGDDEAELDRLRGRALVWLRRAAELAMSRYELEEALGLLGRALPLAPGGGERSRVWRALAHVNALKYAGEDFWTAMQNAIAEADDPRTEAELYAELAFETSLRSGIWKRMPDGEAVDGWIARALAGTPPESVARAQALIARARWRPGDFPEAAREASALAERLTDPVLRSAAWDVRGIEAFVAGEFDLGRAWAERRFELLDQISDPDVRADIHSAPITGCIWNGSFREARRLAQQHDEIAAALTPHHRVHGVAIKLEVEELLGSWALARDLQARAEAAVEANVATPCVRNARSLLVCAVANEVLGQREEARRLEEEAREHWMEGYGFTLDTPLLRLALARGDLDEVERLVARRAVAPGWHRGWFFFANDSTRLDALAALGDRDRVEAEVPEHLRAGTYLEPFALRALGTVRQDEELVRRAVERFEALGLDWHAAETRRLLTE